MQETLLAFLESNSLLAFIGAFGAGSLTAAAPCSLLSVPLLVGSAVALSEDLEGRKKVVYTYLFTTLFALGVMVSFSILGFLVAKFGAFFSIAPLWAYALASLLSIAIALYALGIFKSVDKTAIITYLQRFRLFGGFLIGIIFGLVSTPCASAPLITLIGVASSSGYIYAYALILTFALGHSMLLFGAGVSVGFAQSIVSNEKLTQLSNAINRAFVLMLFGFGIYFGYEAYLQF